MAEFSIRSAGQDESNVTITFVRFCNQDSEFEEVEIEE